jgi:predicted DNA-binding transcriptional regulator YafY
VFDDEQAIAVAVALQTAPTTVMGIGEAAARALASVRQVMPTRLRHRVDGFRVTSISNPWDMDPPQVDPAVLLAVGSAVHGHELLRFDYAPAASDDAATTARSRRVEPHHLVVWSGRWYLVAWDLEREGWQTFRVDRVTPRDRSGIRFAPRELPGPDVTTFVTHQIDRGEILDHWPCRGEAILDVAGSVVARWAPGGAIVEELAPDRCRVTLGAWSWGGLAALLGTFEADIELIGPPELRAACAELAERYAAASADPAAPGPPPSGPWPSAGQPGIVPSGIRSCTATRR